MAKFEGAPGAYVSYMGRFSTPLAPAFAAFALARVDPAQRVLDVGCGPGMLTGELVARHGAERVAAVDPSEDFVRAAAAAHPGVDVRVATAEQLPYDDRGFGAALAQLVVHFMDRPLTGVREMARVTATGGVVAACVWNNGGGEGPLSGFWRVASRLDPDAGEGSATGSAQGQLVDLFEAAGLDDVREELLPVRVTFDTFEDWWAPFTGGVGSGGKYVASLAAADQERLEGALREKLGPGPLTVAVSAWAALGVVPG